MRINHNIAALKAANSLNKNNSKMMSATERLSSGYKINKAADNPAGMAISRKMKTQIAALDRASSNAADGISVIQTAEGAVNEIQAIMQRMRELSVQSANGTNTAEDRATMQAEISQLQEEINSIASKTEFNTKKLLDGSVDRKSYCNSDKISLISLSDEVDVKDYNITVTANAEQAKLTAAGAMNTTAVCPEGTLNINGAEVKIEAGSTPTEIFEAIRGAAEAANIDATFVDAAGNEVAFGTPNAKLQFTSVEYGASKTVEITSSSNELLTHLGLTNASLTEKGKDVEVSIPADSGFSATATVRTNGDVVTITDARGFSMKIRVGDDTVDATTGTPVDIKISVLGAGPMGLQVGASEGQKMEVRIPTISTETFDIDNINLATQKGAEEAIAKMDAAIDEMSGIRAKFGAYQNRLEYTITNLDSASLNMQDSLSRIEDTDMATEMTRYTQYNVLVQAGTAMLSQANELPQQVLALLQG